MTNTAFMFSMDTYKDALVNYTGIILDSDEGTTELALSKGDEVNPF